MDEDRAVQRLKNKTTVEILWPYLLSLMRHKPIYAYEIRQKIEDTYGFKVGQVTSYMVLYKLETSGHVTTKWLEVEARQRKYYTITKKGEKALDESIKWFEKVSNDLKK